MEGRVRGLGMFLLSFRLHSERVKERERERDFVGSNLLVFFTHYLIMRGRGR